jgi:uncharacterized protein YjbI with pentapeptide repeats
MAFIENKLFEKENLSDQGLPSGEYVACEFRFCDFSNSSLAGSKFDSCTFFECNLSLVKLSGTSFQDVSFTNCKLLGLHFEECNPFGLTFTFTSCQLNHSSFYQLKMKNQIFSKCHLEEVDFTESDLMEASFDECILLGARFENTNLIKADFRTAQHYSIDPTINRIKKAKFSLSGIPGLLAKFDVVIERNV